MYKIVSKKILNSALELMEIHAPFVARKCEAGQFIIIRVDEDGERIPLTIADFDRENETVTIIYQKVGYSSNLLSEKQEGDYVEDFVGPLGVPSPLKYTDKKVIGVAGGLGAAPIYPQLKKLHEMGVKVDVIIGGRSKDFIILEEQFREFCDNVYICTDDGSYGSKGVVTSVLPYLLASGNYDGIAVCGPPIMMERVAAIAEEYDLPCEVSLERRMACGLGACLSCSIDTRSGRRKVCKDGPVFSSREVYYEA